MKYRLKEKFPAIGMRIVKSSVAVFLCFLFYFFFRRDGIIFYSQLAALWCIQPQWENTLNKALQRTVGTMTGAVFGLMVLLVDQNLIPGGRGGEFAYAVLVAATIIAVIYVTLLLKKKDASYFSCVVFLSIVVIHIGDANPYLFVFNRVMDTMIGIIIGMLVNSARLPRRKERDILFISGMDDALLSEGQKLSAYSLVELNRMLADGVNFTVSTMRTPASLIEPLRGVKLKLPVIAMDGAVMYDLNKNEYLLAYVISGDTAESLREFLDSFGINYFMNLILDNMLVIQYMFLQNDVEKEIYENLHTSLYRNYTTMNLQPEAECVYFMIVQPRETIQAIYEEMTKKPEFQKLRIHVYDSDDYKGYAYIKIYNENATRENMIAHLKKETGLKKTVTFGSIEGKYDVLVKEYDHNKVVRTLKKMYEPLRWSSRKSCAGLSGKNRV